MNMNPLKKRMMEDSKLNRENKRKQYEKGYYKTHPCNETFICKRCGSFSSNRIAADDNPMKLMSIAMRPISRPPFPIEKIEEMTKMMGGEGSLK